MRRSEETSVPERNLPGRAHDEIQADRENGIDDADIDQPQQILALRDKRKCNEGDQRQSNDKLTHGSPAFLDGFTEQSTWKGNQENDEDGDTDRVLVDRRHVHSG